MIFSKRLAYASNRVLYKFILPLFAVNERDVKEIRNPLEYRDYVKQVQKKQADKVKQVRNNRAEKALNRLVANNYAGDIPSILEKHSPEIFGFISTKIAEDLYLFVSTPEDAKKLIEKMNSDSAIFTLQRRHIPKMPEWEFKALCSRLDSHDAEEAISKISYLWNDQTKAAMLIGKLSEAEQLSALRFIRDMPDPYNIGKDIVFGEIISALKTGYALAEAFQILENAGMRQLLIEKASPFAAKLILDRYSLEDGKNPFLELALKAKAAATPDELQALWNDVKLETVIELSKSGYFQFALDCMVGRGKELNPAPPGA